MVHCFKDWISIISINVSIICCFNSNNTFDDDCRSDCSINDLNLICLFSLYLSFARLIMNSYPFFSAKCWY